MGPRSSHGSGTVATKAHISGPPLHQFPVFFFARDPLEAIAVGPKLFKQLKSAGDSLLYSSTCCPGLHGEHDSLSLVSGQAVGNASCLVGNLLGRPLETRRVWSGTCCINVETRGGGTLVAHAHLSWRGHVSPDWVGLPPMLHGFLGTTTAVTEPTLCNTIRPTKASKNSRIVVDIVVFGIPSSVLKTSPNYRKRRRRSPGEGS